MSGRPTSNPSGALAVGTNVVMTGKFTVNSMQLVPDGTNAATLTIYDNTAASGKVVAVLAAPASSTLPVTVDFSVALKCELGVTAVVAGGTAVAYVNTGGV